MVLQGAMKIVAYDDDEESETHGRIVELVASEERLQIVKVPGHYWHGTKTIGDRPSLTIYFVNMLGGQLALQAGPTTRLLGILSPGYTCCRSSSVPCIYRYW
jgi:hypothetical protein